MASTKRPRLSFETLHLHQQKYDQTTPSPQERKYKQHRRHSSKSKRRHHFHQNQSSNSRKAIDELHKFLNADGQHISINDISANYAKASNLRYNKTMKLLTPNSERLHCGKKRKRIEANNNNLFQYFATKRDEDASAELNELYSLANAKYDQQPKQSEDDWYRQQIKQMEATHIQSKQKQKHKKKKRKKSNLLSRLFELDAFGNIDANLFKQIHASDGKKDNLIILDVGDDKIKINKNKNEIENEFNLTLCDKASCSLLFESEMNIDKIEQIIVGRLRMFEWINALSFEQRKDVIYNQNNHSFADKLRQCKLDCTANDNMSHLLLRLAFCANESLKQFFVANECAFERIKYCKSSKQTKDTFLRQVSMANNDFNFGQYATEMKC